MTAYLLLPAFFIYSGLNTKLNLLFDPATLLMALIVLVAAFAGKFGAVYLAARSQGLSKHEAGALGSLMNARGLMELILLNIGLAAGLVTPTLFTILAIMTPVTTLAATPLYRAFDRVAQKRGVTFGPAGEVPTVPGTEAAPNPR